MPQPTWCEIHERDYSQDKMPFTNEPLGCCVLCCLDVGDEAELDDEDSECCPCCGKEYGDFSDMGCGYCDRRSPDFGVIS